MRKFTCACSFRSIASTISIILLAFFAGSISVSAQSTANYTFVPGNTGSLSLDRNGNAINLATGATTLVPAGSNDVASPATTMPFDFFLNGKRFNTYSVTDNGIIVLGSTLNAVNLPAVSTLYTLPNGTIATLSAFANDMVVGTDGAVRSETFGTAPNRTFVVEWSNNIIRNAGAAPTAGTANWQVRMYEGTGIIEYVYGKMATNDATPALYYIGFSTNTTTNNILTVSTSTNTVSTTTTTNPNTYFANTTLPLNSTSDGSRAVYTVIPPGDAGSSVVTTLAAPTNFTTTAVTTNSYTLNWTASIPTTGVVGYAIYSSVDNVNFTYLTTVALGTNSYAVSSLTDGATAYYKIYAYSEGDLSTPLATGAVTTLASNVNTAIATGNWSAGTTWSTGIVPVATDSVVIPTGITVTMDGADVCNSINVQGMLQYDATTTVRSLTVTKNVNIGATGIFQTQAASTATETLTLGGDLTNAGTLNVVTGTSKATITFTGAQNNVFNCSAGISTNLYTVTENKGAAVTNILDFTPSAAFTVSGANTTGFLTITNGAFKLDGTNTFSNPVFATSGYAIPASGEFWLNNPNATVVGQAASTGTNAGILRISQGIFNVGTAAGNSLILTGQSIIEGGTVNVAGLYQTTGTGAAFIMTNGTVNVATVGNNTSNTGSFYCGAAVIFTLSGGTINIQRSSTGATQLDYELLSTYPSNAFITGGTLNIGTVSGATYKIQGDLPINVSFGATVTGITMSANVYAYGNLTIPSAVTWNTGAFTLNLLQNFVNNGTITGGVSGSGLSFMGSTAQTLSGTGTIPLYIAGLTINNTSGASPAVTISQTDSVNTTLNLTAGSVSGSLVLGARGTGTLTTTVVNGSFASAPIFALTGVTYNVTYNRSVLPVTTGAELAPDSVYTLTINDTSGVTLNNPLNIKTGLTLTNGILTTSAINLPTLNTSVATPPSGSAISYVNGPLGISLNTAANTFKLFAIGKAGLYRPLTLTNFESNNTLQTYTAEVLSGPSGGTGAGSITLDATRYYHLTNTAGISSTTTAGIVLPLGTDDGITSFSAVIAQSATANGTYTSIGSKSNNLAALFDTSVNTIISGDDYISLATGAPCGTPGQPTALTFTGTTATSTVIGFTPNAAAPSGYIIVASTAALSVAPSSGTIYYPGNTLGNGIVVSTGTGLAVPSNFITAAAIDTINNLVPNTLYTITMFPYNNTACGGPVYNTASPLSGTVTTSCGTTFLSPTNISNTAFTMNWQPNGGATGSYSYSIDVSTSNTFATDVAGFPVTVSDPVTSQVVTGLTTGTTYFYRITATGACGTAVSAVYSIVMPVCTPITLAAASYNYDIIINGLHNLNSINNTSLTSPLPFNGFDHGGYDLTSADYSNIAGQGSLPLGGSVKETAGIAGIVYQLAPYFQNNALWFVSGNQNTYAPNTASITFTTPIAASAVYIAYVSGQGANATAYVVHFSDGSTQAFAPQVMNDWCSGTNAVTATIGRTSVTTDGAAASNCPYIYRNTLTILPSNYAKTITSIAINVTGASGTYPAILAASVQQPSVLTTSVTSLSAFGTIANCAPSAPQTIIVSAVHLNPAVATGAGNITVTIPTGFQVSNGINGTYTAGTLNLPYVNCILPNDTLYVRANATTPGTYAGNLTITGGAITNPASIPLSVTTEGINISPSTVAAFGNIAPGASAAGQLYTITGGNLTAGTLTVTSSNTDFQVSPDNSTWANSFPVTVTGTTLASTNVYVRYSPSVSSLGQEVDTVRFSGAGANTCSFIAATGNAAVNCLAPGNPTAITFSPTAVTDTIRFTPPAAPLPDGYLVLQSTTPYNGTLPTNGTSYSTVTGSNTIGNGTVIRVDSVQTQPVIITGLTTNTQYYYTLISYNGAVDANNAGSCFNGPLYGTPVSAGTITCASAPSLPLDSSQNSGGFTIYWAAPAGGTAVPYTYTVDVSTTSAFTSDVTGFPITTSALSTVVSGFTAGTKLYFRVRATGACTGAESPTDSVTLITNTYVDVPVSGFTSDLIANGTGNPVNSTTNPAIYPAGDAGGYFNNGYAFVSPDYSYNGNVGSTTQLPLNGYINSPITAGLSFQLAPYTGNNVLSIYGYITNSQTLTFNTPIYASNLVFLGNGGNTFTVTYKINYTNATSSATNTWAVPDWSSGTGYVLAGVQRVLVSSGVVSGTAGSTGTFRLFQDIVTNPNPALQIASVTFSATANTGGSTAAQDGIFAISAQVGYLSPSVSTLPNINCATASSSFTVNASSLSPAAGNITVTAPAGFLVSADNINFGATATLAYTSSAMTAVPVYVKYNPLYSGSAAGSITFSGGTLNNPPSVAVSASGSGVYVSPVATMAFSNVTLGTNSTSLIDSVKGNSLTPGTITVASSDAQFKVSVDNVNFASSVTYPNGITTDTAIYIQFDPTIYGADSTLLTITGGGGSCIIPTIKATGYGGVICSNPGTPTVLSFSSTATTDTIRFTPAGTAPDGYLLVQSATAFSGTPANGTEYTTNPGSNTIGNGTVIQKNLNSVAQPYIVTGLTANTQYYYTVIAYNGGTTGTCAQGPLYSTPLTGSVITCAAAPGTPTVTNITTNGFTATWTAPATGGTAVPLTYAVDVSTTSTFTSYTTATTSALTLNITGLTGTTYYARVRAIGACSSVPSATSSVISLPLNYMPVTIASGFNNDVIAEGSANPNTTVSNDVSTPGANPINLTEPYFDNGYGFPAANYSFNGNTPFTNSIPANGLITSNATTTGLNFQLANFAGNNALTIWGQAGGTGTLTFATPTYASNLYILGTAGDVGSSPATTNITVTFTDASTQTATWQIPDWFSGTTNVVSYGIGRVGVTAGSSTDGAVSGTNSAGTSGTPRLYELPIPILAGNYGKAIQSVTASIAQNSSINSLQEIAIFAASVQDGYLNPSVTSLPAFTNASGCAVSAVQTFNITAGQLAPASGSITATASTGFLISSSSTGPFASTATFAYTGSGLSATPVYVEFAPSTPGNVAGTITFTGGTINSTASQTVTLTGNGSGLYVTIPDTLNVGNTAVNGTSPSVIDTLKGTGIAAGTITLTSSNSHFAISLNGTNFATTQTMSALGTMNQPVYIQFSPLATGADSTVVTITGGGGTCATSPTIVVKGFGTVLCAAPTTLPTALTFSNTSSTGTGIAFTANGTPDGYLVIQSTAPFTGSTVNGTNYTPGNPIGNGYVQAVISNYPAITSSATLTTQPLDTIHGNTAYNITIIPFNGGNNGTCGGGPLYEAGSLQGSYTTCPANPTIVSATTAVTQATIRWTSSSGGLAVPVTYTLDVSTNNTFTADITGYPVTGITDSIGGDITQLVTGLAASSTYYYRITAIGATCNGVVTGTFTTVAPCAPTFTNGGSYLDYLSTVNFAGIVFSSSSGSITGYVADTATITAGVTAYDTITTGGYVGCDIYIDYNGDGIFQNPGERFFGLYQGGNNATYTSSITVPTTVATGVYRMRVMSAYVSDGTANGPCGTYSYGTYNDFSVRINNPQLFTSVSTLPAFTADACGISGAQSFTLTGSSLNPATGGIVVTAPPGFKVSATNLGNNSYVTSTTFLYSNGTVPTQTIYVKFFPTAGGVDTGTITFSGASVLANPAVTVQGIANGLMVTSATENIGNVTVSSPSAGIKDTLSGIGLTSGTVIVSSSNTDFQISFDSLTWANSITMNNGTSITDTPIYIRAIPSSSGPESTTISFTPSAGGYCAPLVTVNATGTNGCTTPGVPALLPFSNTGPTATTINVTPSGTPDGYIVIESASPFTGATTNGASYTVGAPLGNGTVVVNTAAQPITVTGLTGNTTYYFTIIEYNGGANGTCGGGPLYGGQLASSITTCVATPGSISTSNITSSGFTINWADPSNGGASTLTYKIDVATDNAFANPVTGSPFTVSASTTSLVLTGLTVNTPYFYRITSVTTPVAGSCVNLPSVTGTVSTTAYTYFPIPIASGFNVDAIANGNAAPSTTTTIANGSASGGFDGTGPVFISAGYSYTSGGTTYTPAGGGAYSLPISGNFISVSTPGLPYQLANYTGNNALNFLDNGAGTVGTLTFATPVYADSLFVIGTVANGGTGGANVTLTVTFTDNTTQTTSVNYPDWYSTTSPPYAIQGIGRAAVGAGNTGGSVNQPSFFQRSVGITGAGLTTKIKNIVVNTVSGGTNMYVDLFAVSAQAGTLNASVSSLTAFNGVCAAPQTFTINGSSLFPTGGSIVANAPTGFQVSADGITWGATASFPYAVNTLATTTVYARINPTISAGAESGNITFTGGTANNAPVVAVSGTGSGITVTSTTKAFVGQTINTTSASLNDTLSGAGLTVGTLTLTSSNSDFKISLNGTTFASTATVSVTGTTLATTPIFIQFTPATATAETSTISITGAGNPCTTTITATGTGLPCVTGTWLGTTSNNWGTASNWSCGTIPTNISTVTIAATAPNMPVISSGTYNADTFYLAHGATLTLGSGAILNVAGMMTDSGTISGAGVMVLNGTAAQVLKGTGTISNLTVSNSASITLGILNLTGTLTMTAGTLTTFGSLVLVSNASGTARIAAIQGGSISGSVKVQQYIPGGRRGFRFLGHPFSQAIPLSQLTANMDITGQGGNTNGFATTNSNNPSAFWFNTVNGDNVLQGGGTNAGWTAFTNTNGSGSNAWNPKEGIRILVRGTPGQGLDGSNPVPNPVTLNMNGTVNTGAVAETMVLGPISSYNLFSNPYPSPTDIGTVIQNAGAAISGAAYWVWDINQQTAGAYVPQPISNGAYILPANASFTVKAATASNLTFAETNKAATATASLFKVTNMNNGITLHLYDSAMHSWDVVYVSFNDNAADSMENYDASHLHNSDLDFYSISSNNQQLSIDARPYVTGQVVPLGIATDVQQTYIVKAENFTLPSNEEVYLHDKYLNQYQQLQDGSQYTFSITSDPASQGNSRFELSMAGTATTGVNNVNGSNGLKVSMVPNPATEQVTITYEAPRSEKTSVRIMNMAGQEIINMELGDEQKGSVVIPLHNVAAGMYMLELINGNQIVTQRLVKQ